VAHLFQNRFSSEVFPAGEFAGISDEVFDAHLVVGAIVASVEHRPEQLDAVCMNHA